MAIKILYGDEPYRLDYERNKALAGIGNKAMNYTRYQGAFNSEVLDMCRTVPFFEDKRLVFLDIETLKDLDNDSFNDYLEAPASSTELLILCRKVDSRLKLFKSLKPYLVPCDKVKDDAELKRVIMYELKKAGGEEIQGAALTEFIRRINYFGMDSVTLLTIADYIRTLAAMSKVISLDMVKEFIPEMKDMDVFALASLLKNHDSSALLSQANMVPKDLAIKTLSLILYHFRVAFKEKFFPLSEIGGRPSIFSDCPADTLSRAITLLTGKIAAIKGGYMPDDLALRSALGELLSIL